MLQGRTWQGAFDFCKDEGGHLASIHSKGENDFIASKFLFKGIWGGGFTKPFSQVWLI